MKSSNFKVSTPVSVDWTLAAVDGKITNTTVSAVDQLSITLQMSVSATKMMEVPIVRGSGMISAKVTGLTPILRTPLKITQAKAGDTVVFPGPGKGNAAQLDITLSDGRVWTVFLSAATDLIVGSNFVKFAAPFTGNIRAAFAGTEAAIVDIAAYKDVVPIGGVVDYTNTAEQSTITFAWTRVGLADWAPVTTGNVMMYALPHHFDILTNPTKNVNLNITTIKGNMTVVGDATWTMVETLNQIGWFMPREYNLTSTFGSMLYAELEKQWPIDAAYRASSSDSYNFGVELAKMARIGSIGVTVNYTEAAVLKIRTFIKNTLADHFKEQTDNPPTFDELWGGIVSKDGKSATADWGNGIYTDHLKHYGYLLYAAAWAIKNDTSGDMWATNYTENLLYYARDIANPNPSDPYFPVTRYKDWFCGHSWSTGLMEYGDNRSQMSSSEAVHAYYAIALLGNALNNTDIETYGRMLMMTEIRSAKKYFQIPEDSVVYPEPFKSNRMAGVVWDSQVYYTTWMGGDASEVHGVQLMPFTPATTVLIEAAFATQEYAVIGNAA